MPLDDAALKVLSAQVLALVGAEVERRLDDPVVEERAVQAAFAFYMKHLMSQDA